MFPLNTIISENNYEEKQIKSKTQNFFKEIELYKLLKQSNITKLSGASCLVVFKFIMELIFTGKNLYQLLNSKSSKVPFGKDVVYRFLNSVSYNWRNFLLLLSSAIINQKLFPLTSDERVNTLIFDDSVYNRNRSKCVELLAKVKDSARDKYIKGFRMLTAAWSDGNTLLPLAFSLLSSRKEKNRYCEMNENIDKRTNGYKRRKESLKKATETMFDLLKDISKFSFPIDYVLFDSWFAYPKIIKQVLEFELPVVCRLKRMPNIFYTYKNQKLNLKQLYKKVKKKSGKVAASVIVTLGQDKNGHPIKVKIIFVQDNKNKDKWVALLSTDISLDAQEIIRIYGKRWDIEVFFKMTKSYLRLAKEFQGRSYDMMFAHTTVVFTRYIMLSVNARTAEDSRTLGGLFFECCDELKDIEFAEALFLLIDLFKQTLSDCLIMEEEKMNEVLDYFFSLVPSYIKERLGILNCES